MYMESTSYVQPQLFQTGTTEHILGAAVILSLLPSIIFNHHGLLQVINNSFFHHIQPAAKSNSQLLVLEVNFLLQRLHLISKVHNSLAVQIISVCRFFRVACVRVLFSLGN